MRHSRVISQVLQGACLVLLLTSWLEAAAQPGQEPPLATAPAGQQGVEVLARGPVHEAFADPAQAKSQAMPTVAKEPPAAIEELPPEQKPEGNNVQWIPGYFAWDDERNDFLWVSGFWRVPPPGRQWVPGRWNKTAGGWQWVPGFWGGQQQQEITYLPPPPEPVEAGPSVPAPSPDHIYVSGGWVYRDSHYIWRPGYWSACRRGWVWVPAHYVWTPCGYVFVDGYWDYTLRERGVLFAPAYVDVAVCYRPGWCYTPAYVIADDCLVGALFVRPGYCHYYFGDYFEPCHRQAGFVAWFEFGGGHCRDPLFSYYRFEYRSVDGWEVGLRTVYVGRYRGEIARPPRTLIQQTTVVNNITVNNITNNVNKTTVNNVTNNNTNVNKTVVNNIAGNGAMLTSLNQMDKKGVKLTTLAPEARVAERAQAQQLVKAAAVRGQAEAQVLAHGPAPTKPTDPPRVAKMELPSRPTVAPAVPHPLSADVAKPQTGVPHPGQPAPNSHPVVTPAPHPSGVIPPSAIKPAAPTPLPPTAVPPTAAHPNPAHPVPPARPAPPDNKKKDKNDKSDK